MTNGNINWTTIILGTIVAAMLWLSPSPVFKSNNGYLSTWNPNPNTSTHTVDTIHLPAQPISGNAGAVVPAQPNLGTVPVEVDSAIGGVEIPYYFEQEDSAFTEQYKARIRTTVYPFKEDDSLKAYIATEWNIEVRPLEIIKTDSIFVLTPVEVPAVVPFYEKPEFVIPATAIVTYTIVKLVEGLLGRK